MERITVTYFTIPDALPHILRLRTFNELSKSTLRYDLGRNNNPLDIFERKYMMPAYQRFREDLEAAVKEHIAPQYKKLNRYNTLLSQNQIDLLCATATMSLGGSASLLALEMNLDTLVEIQTERQKFKLDGEIFLRKLQNRLFEQYTQECGFGVER